MSKNAYTVTGTKYLKGLSMALIAALLVGCLPGADKDKKDDDCKDKNSVASSKDNNGKNDKKECPKDDDTGSTNPPAGPAPIPNDPTRVCTVDKFKQATGDDQFLKKVDILFVMDTSGSMSDDWARVANNVVELVKELPSGTDIRYAVLLGHVGDWQGKLFYTKKNANSDRPVVLDNQTMSTQEISVELHKRFTEAMKVSDPGSGEALFHSLYYAVTTKAAENQKLGFFRPDAALSVLFMSDEHEIGSLFPKPQAPGLPDRCDERYEEDIRREYYTKKGINVDVLLKEMRAFKGDMPVRASAFINITKEDLFKRNNKNASCLYDSLGYGYFDIVAATKGVQFSIQENRVEGMKKVGQCVRDSLVLVHDFKLSWPADEIDPKTIQAAVDGGLVDHEYKAITNMVHLENAGAAGSNIEISYCKPEQRKDWNLVGFNGQAALNSVSLRWDTPEVATNGRVIWGLTPNSLSNTANEASPATNHLVTVDGLQSDTVYYFQAISKDEFGLEKRSVVVDVRTLAPPTDTNTDTNTDTGTDTTTDTGTNTNTDTGTNTGTNTGTDTNTVTDTGTSTGTNTDTGTNTNTDTGTNTGTNTGTDTNTVTDTGTSTGTTTDTGTNTNTDTGTGTNTGTDTSTDTNTDPPNTTWQVLGFDGTTSPTTATLIWQTPGVATRAVIRMGTAADGLTNTIDVTDMAQSHIYTIEGLIPNTTYYFQVMAIDQHGRAVESVVISKKTKAE